MYKEKQGSRPLSEKKNIQHAILFSTKKRPNRSVARLHPPLHGWLYLTREEAVIHGCIDWWACKWPYHVEPGRWVPSPLPLLPLLQGGHTWGDHLSPRTVKQCVWRPHCRRDLPSSLCLPSPLLFPGAIMVGGLNGPRSVFCLFSSPLGICAWCFVQSDEKRTESHRHRIDKKEYTCIGNGGQERWGWCMSAGIEHMFVHQTGDEGCGFLF